MQPTTPAGACTATLRTTGTWPGGFQAEVTVTAGSAGLSGWTVGWSSSSFTVSQLWSGEVSSSGSGVTVRNAAWNGTLPAGGSTTFGFIGTGTPATPTLSCA
ncbi:hypothetical protein ATM99_02975 [Cellulomonas sp. B6]|nr:hypothetical protein ATM99_02975 [Cellulomonas sp. B6]